MAVNALILLGLLLLLACASVAEEELAMEALFAHIREIQQISKSGLEDLENSNVKAGPLEDSVASLGVESSAAGAGMESPPVGGAVDAEEVVVGDAASDLMAHILAVQRKALEATEERERLRADGSEEVAVEGADGEEEEEKEVEQDEAADPLAQERFKELEAMLKTLTENAVDGQEELGSHKVQLSAGGAKGDDVINLLHKYAQEMHVKLYPNGAPQPENEAAGEHGEIDSAHSKNHDDHLHLHEHDHRHDHEHGHVHGHHHHDHGHGDAHSNVGFSRASDAHYHDHDHSGHSHEHDHSGHSHEHDHRESIKKKKFMLPEEIAEEEDLLQYAFEGQVYSSAEQLRRWRGPDTGSFISFTVPAYVNVILCLTIVQQ